MKVVLQWPGQLTNPGFIQQGSHSLCPIWHVMILVGVVMSCMQIGQSGMVAWDFAVATSAFSPFISATI